MCNKIVDASVLGTNEHPKNAASALDKSAVEMTNNVQRIVMSNKQHKGNMKVSLKFGGLYGTRVLASGIITEVVHNGWNPAKERFDTFCERMDIDAKQILIDSVATSKQFQNVDKQLAIDEMQKLVGLLEGKKESLNTSDEVFFLESNSYKIERNAYEE